VVAHVGRCLTFRRSSWRLSAPEIADALAILAIRREPFRFGNVNFLQGRVPELGYREVTFRPSRTISPPGPATGDGIKQPPGGFRLGPLADPGLVGKEEKSGQEQALPITTRGIEIEDQGIHAERLCHHVPAGEAP
jgi:hypothetical protein